MGAFLDVLGPFSALISDIAMVIPQNAVGYQPDTGEPPLLFHIEGENTADLEMEITDHYLEDNTSLEDHAALPPPIVTVHGFIGELRRVLPIVAGTTIVQQVQDALPALSAFSPELSLSAQLAFQEAEQIYQAASTAALAAGTAFNSLTTGEPGQAFQTATLQQLMFGRFLVYRKKRTKFTVQTPWAIFKNMMPMRIRATQDENSKMMTDFYVTFKQIRTTADLSGSRTPVLSGRANEQAANAVENGTVNAPVATDLLTQLEVTF